MLHFTNAISCGIRASLCNRAGLAVLVALLAGADRAAAQPVTHGAAFGEQLTLKLQTGPLIVQVASGPLPAVAGDAPPYSRDASALSANVGLGAFGTVLRTGLLQSHTDSAAAGQASSTAVVHTFALVPSALLLSLHADEVRSSAAIGGTCGSALTATGSTTLANAGGGGLLGQGLHLRASYPPNTVLLNLLGAKVVVNEQIASGDGVTSRALAVNALHISLQNSLLALVGRLTGDIVIAHAEARVVCAPQAPPPSGEADLILALTADPQRLILGQAVTYTVDVSNDGPDDAASTRLTDILPAGLAQVTVQASQGGCSGTSTIVCDLGALTAGNSAEVVISGVPTLAGVLLDAASVTSAATDPSPDDSHAAITLRAYTGQEPRADLSLIQQVSSGRVSLGALLTYELVVANAGPDGAPNTVVTDPLLPGLQLLSVISSQGSCAGTATIVCNLGTVPAGGVASVTLVMQAQGTGNLENQAWVSTDAADLDDTNDTDLAVVTVIPPAIRQNGG